MHAKNLSINAMVMSFMFSCLVFGFLAIGVVAAAPVEHKSGDWVKKDYAIKGGWSIEHRDNMQVITFDKKFKTKNGPDLKVFLSPKSIDAVNGGNATEGSVLVAVLKKNKGTQEYVLPDDIDLSQFGSLLIHCEQFGVLWGGANLS